MKVIEFKRNTLEESLSENIKVTNNLDYVLKNSDFISLHVPLTELTKNMIDKKQFEIMKPNAFLINTARGEVVNNNALIEALESRKIAGAALDVYEGEVPFMDNPIFKFDNVIATPHTAAHTVEAMGRMSLHPAIGIHEVLSGQEPSWPVN